MISSSKQPLISVIVPIFQVEAYLERCILSIITQTYHNLEIILVDDGSPDGCSAICDKWQAKDSRIKVCHQKNGGLSVARNTGLKLASGDFIGFVDSDDWIEPNMFERLFAVIQDTDADVAACDFFQEKELSNVSVPKKLLTATAVKLYSGTEAMRLHLQGTCVPLRSFVWNKVYRRTVLENIFFAEGKVFEDILWTTQIIGNARSVVCIQAMLYHYCFRTESLAHSCVNLDGKIGDCSEMHEKRIQYIHERFPDLEKLAIAQYQSFCCAKYVKISLEYRRNDEKNDVLRRKLYHSFCKWGWGAILAIPCQSVKIAALIFRVCPKLLLLLVRIYYRLCGKGVSSGM